jgi:hypothetical protein
MFALRSSTGQIIALLDRRAGRDGIISTNYANSDPPGRVGCVHMAADLTGGRIGAKGSHLTARLPDLRHLL